MEETISHLLRQRYPDFEVLAINDGSKDVSYAVCQSYAGIDRRIVVIDKNNSGVSATRNLGMQEAHGKYFQFVDADDFIQPYATELLVQKAEASHADMEWHPATKEDRSSYSGDHEQVQVF